MQEGSARAMERGTAPCGRMREALGQALVRVSSEQPTLLLLYRSFTPLPVLVCRMVLYSPSSSSLMS